MSNYRTHTHNEEKLVIGFSNDDKMVESQIIGILEWANRHENSPLKTLSFNRVGHEHRHLMVDAIYEEPSGGLIKFVAQLDEVSEEIDELIQETFK